MNEIVIEIPIYIRKVVISNAIRPKYFEPKDKLPLKYQNLNFQFKPCPTSAKGKTKILLVDIAKGEKVIKNPKVCGEQKTKLINGQKIYNGEIQRWDRAKMMDAIKLCFQPYIKNVQKITSFPLVITAEVHDFVRDPELKNQLWDLDNRFYVYQKCFQDILVKEKIIAEDDVLHITGSPAPKFIPLYPGEERKLIFKINLEIDPRILNHPEYKPKEDDRNM